MTSSPRRRSTARTPVTIDLEAQKIEEDVQEAEAPTPDEQSVSDTIPSPEPVATEAFDKKPADVDETEETVSSEEADSGVQAASVDGPAGTIPTSPLSSKQSGSPIIAGLIGGLIVLVGGAGLQYAGILPSANSTTPQAQVDMAPMQTQIDALKAQLESSSAASTAALPEDMTSALSSAIQTSDNALAQVQSMKQSVADLATKTESLQSAVANGGAGENAGLESLAQRIESVEGQLGDIAAKMTAMTDGTGSRVNMEAELAPVMERLVTLESEISQASEAFSDISNRVSALDARIGDAEAKITDSGSNISVAKAIAVAGLKSAIDRGGSFMSELEAYATVVPDSDIVVELRNYAAGGVPTINQLTDTFPAVANKIVATGQGLAEDSSIADRLMASARSLVQIRPKGEVAGETPGAIAARIEERLKAGNLSAALTQWGTLPDAAKQVSTDFADQMRARLSVDEMVANALTGAMSVAAPASPAN